MELSRYFQDRVQLQNDAQHRFWHLLYLDSRSIFGRAVVLRISAIMNGCRTRSVSVEFTNELGITQIANGTNLARSFLAGQEPGLRSSQENRSS
ncbi:hypothetical protein EVAR_78010_1 [Eumeta japonica]|uniref:Uncharacterized protein n=1 Tax=Eumeta variegata TaxID=151549 RepID=A0A4C1T021_EUMVA|nr:hypothetical protein EVAR_78010_1 [Eumeta japonica]